MSEDEATKIVVHWGELQKNIFRLSSRAILLAKSEAITQILKMHKLPIGMVRLYWLMKILLLQKLLEHMNL